MNLKDMNAEITAREEDVFMKAMEDHALIQNLGIVGVSPYDPTLQSFLAEALAATEGEDDLREFILKNWRTGK